MENSIIICAYNEEKLITNCLNSIIPQIINEKKTELIIVDDGSTDRTSNVCKDVIKNYNSPKNITLKKISHRGLFEARNFGVDFCKGSFIYFLDSDALIDKNWYESIQKSFFDKNVNIVSGKVKHLNINSKMATFLFYAHYDCIVQNNSSRILRSDETYLIGANMGFRRSALKKIGPFITLLKNRGDDTYISKKHKLVFPNGKEFYNNEAIVYNEHTNSLLEWFSQGFFGGRNNFLISKTLSIKTKINVYTNALTVLLILSLFTDLALLLFLILLLIRFFSKMKFLIKSFKNTLINTNLIKAFLVFPLHLLAFNLHDLGFIYQSTLSIFNKNKWTN